MVGCGGGYGQGPRWAMTSSVYIRTLMTDQPLNPDPDAAKPGPEEPTRRDSEAMLGGKPPQDPLIGTTVDQYSIKRVIGEGGMGVVYEALQQSPRRTVAEDWRYALAWLHRELDHEGEGP